MSNSKVLELVSFILVNLVDHPDDVKIQPLDKDGEEIFQVSVNAEDLGKVIGKGGQTAKSIRSLLQAVGARDNKRYGFEIAEED
jgi:uncharacterized protein